MKSIVKVYLLLIAFIAVSFSGYSQETTSEIQGLISNAEGPIPFVTVIATHQPTGTKYGTTTREDVATTCPT